MGANLDLLVRVAVPNFWVRGVSDILEDLLPYIFSIAGFLLLGYLVYGGYQILMSQGDPKAVAAGREKIQSAIIGFIIIFAAYWIVQIVARILGLEMIVNMFR